MASAGRVLSSYTCAPCPECGEAVTSATHNRDLDLPALIERHQGWTVEPCGHHPAEYPTPIKTPPASTLPSGG